MSAVEDFRRYFAECPLIAIVRGVTPAEAEAVAGAVYDAGIRIIEVPLNSPEPFDSIRIIADTFGGRAMVGAGTVLDPADVAESRAGGRQADRLAQHQRRGDRGDASPPVWSPRPAISRRPRRSSRSARAPTASSCSRPKRPRRLS